MTAQSDGSPATDAQALLHELAINASRLDVSNGLQPDLMDRIALYMGLHGPDQWLLENWQYWEKMARQPIPIDVLQRMLTITELQETAKRMIDDMGTLDYVLTCLQRINKKERGDVISHTAGVHLILHHSGHGSVTLRQDDKAPARPLLQFNSLDDLIEMLGGLV